MCSFELGFLLFSSVFTSFLLEVNYTYPVSTNFSFSRESICLFQSRHRCCHILPFPGWNISLNEEWQGKTEKCFFFFGLTLLLGLFCCCCLLSKQHHVSDGCDYLYSSSYKWNRKEESLLSSWVWVSCSPYFTFYSELTACRSREKAGKKGCITFSLPFSPPPSYFFNSVLWLLCFCQVHSPGLCMSYAFQMFFSCS